MEAMLERRPMSGEERTGWKRRMQAAEARERQCETCGSTAPHVLGDPLTGAAYCGSHITKARQLAELARMRASK